NKYVENENIKNSKGVYRKASLDDKLLARSNYSQDKETESDLEGLKLFLNSNYDIKSIQGVFDILDYSHTPFDNVAFRKSFLENQHLQMPQNYFLTKTAPIVTADELSKMIYKANRAKDETKPKPKNKKEKAAQEEAEKEKERQEEIDLHKYSTHPAIEERRKAVEDALKDEDIKKGNTYIIGEKEFLKIRKMARFENSSLYLQDREYEQALYNTYLLMQENPKSIYLQKCLVKSLYGMAKYASTTRFQEVHTPHDFIVGHSQQVHYLVEKISASELTVLALSHAWELKKKVPQDEEVKALVEDLFAEMVDNYYPRKSFFSSVPRQVSASGTAATGIALGDGFTAAETDTMPAPKKKASRKRKVKTVKKKTKFNKASDMNQYAFVEQLQDPEFVAMYDEQTIASKKRKADTRKEKTYSYKKAQAKKENIYMRSGDALGLDKVVFINPFYYKINLTKKKSLRYLASEAAQKRLNNKIKENATLAGLDFDIVDKKALSDAGTAGYNENAVLNDFIDEMADHGDIHFVNYMNEDMQQLTKKYDTDNFVWTGFISVKQKKETALVEIMAAVMYPMIIPYVTMSLLTPDYDTYFYSVVIDVKTGKKLKTNYYNLSIRDRNDVLDGTLYDLYSQYKNKPAQPAKSK
ncbi:MAG: hypothetical protein ACXWDO_09220, partial [Bacteroidia bacterium]